MKIIAKYIAGSYSYGLKIPESDIDERYLFIHTEISKIIGLEKHDHQSNLTNGQDSFGYELRNFLNLLKKGNSQAIELLHNNIWIEKSTEFDYFQNNRNFLIDSEKIFRCLLGYVNGEKHIILGKITGKLGDKRKKQLEEFGYSYKNCVHALRLLRTGIIFFKDNIYPVNIVEQDKEYGNFIRNVKLNPSHYQVDKLMSLIKDLEIGLKKSFDNRAENYQFSDAIANQICFNIYFPVLKKFDN